MSDEIINRVANSSLVNFDLEAYYPKGQRQLIDLKDWLFEGLILKEKDFRQAVKDYDWVQHQDQYVAIDCSADAIVPVWSYMLISNAVSPYAKKVVKGNLENLESIIFHELINSLDINTFKNQRVIVKGCSNLPVPESAYVAITNRLSQVVKSIMYGEACSSVPIYKKK
tara:strand:+ start:15213 stop:15719 length:507 start_codon:yes stop_codon:yes gene_type:complete